MKIYKAPKVVKADTIARKICGKRTTRGHMFIPPRGYFMNMASGFPQERPKGKLNIASGNWEE